MSEHTWTHEQVVAIRSETDTLLEASAGTGKTTTVVGKILWQLGLDSGMAQENGELVPRCTDPCELQEIAAITFTDKGARDLKRQLRVAIEDSARADELRWQIDRAYIGTIHGYCGRLLRENALIFNIDPTFEQLDEFQARVEQDRIIEDVVLRSLQAGETHTESLLGELGNLHGRGRAKGVIDHIRDTVHELRWRAEFYSKWSDGKRLRSGHLRKLSRDFGEKDMRVLHRCDELFRLAKAVLPQWDEFLVAENARDFDSLILELHKQLHASENASALEKIRRRYRLLIIDEFQDTDVAQRDIAFAIGHGQTRPQLFFVGDPKQSIYAFRGADIAVWNSTKTALADSGSILKLSGNFRCAPPIVNFVNITSETAMGETGQALDADLAKARIQYSGLKAVRGDSSHSSVEWLRPDGELGRRKMLMGEFRDRQAAQVATRIQQLIETGQVHEKETDKPRKCELRDIAILYRARTGLESFTDKFDRYEIPHHVTGVRGLAKTQEALDLINALRLLNNPHDDRRAFAFLRSPFVCLRDEVIARLRLLSTEENAPLLTQAARFLGDVDSWPSAPEHERLGAIEKESLRRGLRVIEHLSTLVHRMPLDETLEQLLQRTGYRLHLLLHEEKQALSNIDELLRFAEGYRDLDVDTFLEYWKLRDELHDKGLPEATRSTEDSNVVTLSTIHNAKGLEWPIVFLVCVERKFHFTSKDKNEFWTDPVLGPALIRGDDEGPRIGQLQERKKRQANAEESRLLYVATTRARDRLILVGDMETEGSYGMWLNTGVGPLNMRVRNIEEAPPPRRRQEQVSLSWLDEFRIKDPNDFALSLPEPPLSFTRSATELMLADKDRELWEKRYRHGVIDPRDFIERDVRETSVPGNIRGEVIHGVLEKVGEGSDLESLLRETIAALVPTRFVELMSGDTDYGADLEREIRNVLQDKKSSWYFKGNYYPELPFVHFLTCKDWRIGHLDLYRPDPEALVIDFKTHQDVNDQESADKVAEEYRIQVEVYRDAASVRSKAEVRLFFTQARKEVLFTG